MKKETIIEYRIPLNDFDKIKAAVKKAAEKDNFLDILDIVAQYIKVKEVKK